MTVDYIVYCAIIAMQLALLAKATDLLGGHVGRTGVSAVLIAAISGYAYSIIAVQFPEGGWLCVALALAVALTISTIMGWLLLRLRGDNFLLGTLALQMGFLELANNMPVLGGPLGLRDIPPITAPIVLLAAGDAVSQGVLWLLLPTVIVGSIVLQRVVDSDSRSGQILHWIRDDQVSARSFGIAPSKWELGAFVLHALISAVVGISIAALQGYISPKSFDLTMSIAVLTVVYLSGTGGRPIMMYVGSVIVVAINEYLSSFGNFPELVGPIQQIVINGLLILILCLMRRGLAGPVIELGPSAARLE